MARFPIDLAALPGPVLVLSEPRPDVDRETGAQRLRDERPVWLVDVLWPAQDDRTPTVERVKVAAVKEPQLALMQPFDADEFVLSTWTMNGRQGTTLQAVLA